MKTLAKVCGAALAVIMSAGSVVGTAQASVTDTSDMPAVVNVDSAIGLNDLLEYMDSIPDAVLTHGDRATQAWMDSHPMAMDRRSFLGCAAAIAGTVASTAFPAAKILRIKKYIKELGGIREAISIMWGASFSAEKLKALSLAAGSLAAELTGISSIRSQCFS